ncbi:acyl-CoA dehydrogenase family protein [Bacillus wiedmannii]|uniref:acyl-CoA dehydrogenase family protein n=1 Tax=Bacillus wiedmannii TaxID=1890302 RepID=UPI0021CFB651|nr:acyl-CoA dehydrogenase family protein [Bacillus wiedmannii]MCU5112990.1 acyl-CoA dehydrogenase family protein [Bacillus wiedmannii]MCU5152976.1 acyl-CoA dehydrogenase family protein [Bacillus wiedmannii]MCU5412404.1 acyl-CoA dehydrogenase family protein [Bacillus wiedmannii]HDR7782780.1 acyl-CoA dehydrogenase family protein [Bacillus wiedmannii]
MEKTKLPWDEFFSLNKNVNHSFFTPEDFSGDEDLIAKTTEQFVKQEIVPQMETIEQHNYEVSRQLFKKAGELGLLSIEVPEEYGGFELGKAVSGLVAEKMGYAGAFSVSFNIHAGVGTLPYIYYGTKEQKEKYLPKIASGEWIGAYALTEPNAGSDALSAKTSAVLNEDGTAWKLNGEKQWITNAHMADVYVVFAKTNKGMTAFIVERTCEGVSIGLEEKKMGIKGSSTATLILEDVVIPAENVLGEVGKGHHVALNILNFARLKLAFGNIGTAKQAIGLSVQYGKERKQFQTELVDFTMIQEKIANMIIATYGAESAAYRTAGVIDEAIHESDEDLMKKMSQFAIECALNKVNASETLGHIVDEAVQIHGGYGYMQEYEVERLYRDARISRIFEGTNEINRLTVAKMLMKQMEQIEDTEVEIDVENVERNHRYILLAKKLLKQSLKTLSKTPGLKIDQEQEYSRVLSNMLTDVYVMESAFLRTSKAISKNGDEKERTKQMITDVICEEGYRNVEEAAVSILSAAVTEEQDRHVILTEIRQLLVPLYTNVFTKKREIAKAIINRGKYIV